MQTQATVIVVGAGLSGTSAARVLHEHGVEVILLEASERIGGRLHTRPNEKLGWVDVGGQYLGPTQDNIAAVAKELGIQTRPIHDGNNVLMMRKGETIRYNGFLPPMGSVQDRMDNDFLLREIDQLVKQVDAAEPWKCKDAAYLDKITFQDWMNRHITSEAAKDSARVLTLLNMTAEPWQISMLWMLWYIKASGGLDVMTAITNGAQEKSFIGGSQQIPIKLAKKLPEGKVFLNHPVNTVNYTDDGVVLQTNNGKIFKAKYVILAMPPSSHQRVNFVPALPTRRNQLIQRTPIGSVIKVIIAYDKPYWRQKGLSGLAYAADMDKDNLVLSTMEDSYPGATWGSLVGFVAGEAAVLASSMSSEDRKASIVKQYARMFDCPELLHPIVYEEKNWCEDPWSGGCYSMHMATGIMSLFGSSLREPIGRIHFAGTETATKWSGYMDGAIQAGHRAAREVMDRLGVKHTNIQSAESETRSRL